MGNKNDLKRVAIIGFGNVGKAVFHALKDAKDMRLDYIVARSKIAEDFSLPSGVKVLRDSASLSKADVDVAILTIPSRQSPDAAAELLAKGISCVDSYDIHSSIYDIRTKLDKVARDNGSKAIIASGWDPGTDSYIRAIFKMIVPSGLSYTNFGPGMSMGHSTCVKNKDGVTDALSVTIPKGEGLHRRMVYVELEKDADFDSVCEDVKTDPYFINDETYVFQVESVADIRDVGHGVVITRKGRSSDSSNQRLNFEMRIDGPAITAQILVSTARACIKREPGCYTLIEVPVIDFLQGDLEELIHELV